MSETKNVNKPVSLQSCQADLVKDNGHKYFLSVLADSYMPVSDLTNDDHVLDCHKYNVAIFLHGFSH